MDYTQSEVLQFVSENDVKFIRLAFCDIFGNMKNISIMPGELSRAFRTGISFDASRLLGMMDFMDTDLSLFPDPATLKVLPWRPSHGRVVRLFCDIRCSDGTPFLGDGRNLLRQTEQKLKKKGLTAQIGTECEFYLFERDDAGRPTSIPFDHAGYLDVAPLDKGENVRRDICLTLEKMGISPSASHHEKGPGQNEIHFNSAPPLLAADNFITFKSVVKTMAASNGLFASFLPLPLKNEAASGLHVNISLEKGGANAVSESFIAGVLSHAAEITVFLNPLTNSYERLGTGAPNDVSWSYKNLPSLLRVKKTPGGTTVNLRSPDAASNPYWALCLILNAGLDGIARGLPLCPPAETQEAIGNSERLPLSLKDAAQAAADSLFISTVLPRQLVDFYTACKIKEFETMQAAESAEAFCQNAYFLTV